MRTPRSTYRLQISSDFTLTDAHAQLDYLVELGADWVYLSPLLVAEPGSNHGYDVVDHSAIDPLRGGAEALATFAQAAHDRGLGLLLDIVPNHVGVATPVLNAWWWNLLAEGQSSRFAEAFDVDWDFGRGKLRIPVLGDDSLDALTLVAAEAGEFELHYYENRFPVAAGTAVLGDSPIDVHARQNYELMNWRRADAELNYRRFFAVNSLAAIRVELPWVFNESHAEVRRWFADGIADGLRVDHPDGLYDPAEYLERLAELSGGSYVVVEKILEGSEQLPEGWHTAGTSGYDALGDFDRVLVDPAAEDALKSGLSLTDAQSASDYWHDMIHGTKRMIADTILRSEILRLDRELHAEPTAELTAHAADTADALAELAACFPVYRSYLPDGLADLEHAFDTALGYRPELAEVLRAVTAQLANPSTLVARRFQQTSGMVMAKGVEDTAFYRFNRLVSLNEVGAQPQEFAITAEEFHTRQLLRLAHFPQSMTNLSTHDTKRGEDTRARIDAISEFPNEWATVLAGIRALAPLGTSSFDVLLWQSAIGAWPLSRERLHAYAEKASREANDDTGWAEPNEQFEINMHAAIDQAFDGSELSALIDGFVRTIEHTGWNNSLAAKLLQLTTVGSPDVYQGSELWETSLVDPDNRRPIDYSERARMLTALAAPDAAVPTIAADAAAKLLVTSRALTARRDHPELFTGYESVTATGTARDHLLAFNRGGAITAVTRLSRSLEHAGGWGDTTITLESAHRDALTGRIYGAGTLAVAELFAALPVALLLRHDSATS